MCWLNNKKDITELTEFLTWYNIIYIYMSLQATTIAKATYVQQSSNGYHKVDGFVVLRETPPFWSIIKSHITKKD